jgi:predicted nucleotidyltransferase
MRREAEVDTMTATKSRKVPVPEGEIAAFCRRWEITELVLFGSVLKDDFGPESDVDVLVTFSPEARWTLFDLVKMQEELATIFGRAVDLVSRRGLDMSRNYLRRKAILSGSEVIYAA